MGADLALEIKSWSESAGCSNAGDCALIEEGYCMLEEGEKNDKLGSANLRSLELTGCTPCKIEIGWLLRDSCRGKLYAGVKFGYREL